MVTALWVGIIIALIIIGVMCGMLASIKGELEILELYCQRLEYRLKLINREMEWVYKETVNISDEWTISPEKAEKIYNTAQENMRGYHKE